MSILRPAVSDAWWRINKPWEGVVYHMYRDTKGWVTVGLGNKIDPAPDALSLPFEHRSTGRLATSDEIWEEWRLIKHSPGLNEGGHLAARRLTKLVLTEAGVRTLVLHRIASNAVHLARRWPGFPAWPADAQFAISSWAYACGSAAKYPRMSAALAAGNFAAAALEVAADKDAPKGSTIHDRNRANAIMLRNAQHVADLGLNPDVLYYPHDIGTASTPPPECA